MYYPVCDAAAFIKAFKQIADKSKNMGTFNGQYAINIESNRLYKRKT